MKKLLLVTSLFAAITLSSSAQVNTNTPTGNFFNTVESYFTAFNTNLTTFQSEKLELWAGVDYQQNYNVSSSLGLEYKPFNNIIKLESVTRNAGIAGTILSQQAGIGLAWNLYDLEFGIYADGGYQFDTSKPFLALAAEAKKALSENTFMGVRIETDFDFNNQKNNSQIPVVSALVGFKF